MNRRPRWMIQCNQNTQKDHPGRIYRSALYNYLDNSHQPWCMDRNKSAIPCSTELGVDFVDDEVCGESGLDNVENARDKEKGRVAETEGRGRDSGDVERSPAGRVSVTLMAWEAKRVNSPIPTVARRTSTTMTLYLLCQTMKHR
jgi:hypothetical protein